MPPRAPVPEMALKERSKPWRLRRAFFSLCSLGQLRLLHRLLHPFLRAGAPRFAFLDFFATFNLPNRISQNYATRYHALAAYLNWEAV